MKGKSKGKKTWGQVFLIIDRKPRCVKKQDVEHKMYAEKQSGEGFWSIAPGCGDISEGMVWVSVIRKNK